MPIFLYSCFLFFLLLQACNLETDPGTRPSVPDTSDGARIVETVRDDTGKFHQVSDDRTAGRVKPQAHSLKDPATGTTYQINPNWGIVQRKPRTAVEALLPGTNGLIQTYTDWSGQVETRIYECVSPTTAASQNSVGCQVEADFILVGGGAWANVKSGSGAFIWESRPLDATLSTWVGSSKEHWFPGLHSLHVYAIGLRLKDNSGNYIPKTTLLGNYIRMVSKTTPQAARRQEQYIYQIDWGLPPGPIQGTNLGGGARANWAGSGAYLTEVGAGQDEWTRPCVAQGISKDHMTTDYHTMTLYAISMKPDANFSPNSAVIPNFGQLQAWSRRVDGPWVATGASMAMLDTDPGWVMTTLGGQGRSSSGPGRLLIGVKPTGTYTGQVSAYSKDHLVTSAGVSAAFLSETRKRP
jgi:hypothetical protein